MTNQFGSKILKIFSQKSFSFTETRFMEQKRVNWISYWIREVKINILNLSDYQDSAFIFGGWDLTFTCAGDRRGYSCPCSLQKIALLFVQVTGPIQPGHMYILVFIALKQI